MIGSRQRKKENVPKYPCRSLSPEEIARAAQEYTPPLSREEIFEKQSTPSPDRSHWKDKR